MQFWRDAIAEIYSGNDVRQHPVAHELRWTITRHSLDRGTIEQFLTDRQRDLSDEPPASIAALEGHVEGTSARLLELAVRTLGDGNDPATDVVRNVGAAFGLSGLLRAVPFHARQRRLYLPADQLDEAGVDRESVFAGKFSPALAAVVAAVADCARDRLARSRDSWRDVPPVP